MSPSFQSSASPQSALEANGIATTKVSLSLGHELVNYATEAPDPPKPLQDVAQYDKERIKVGLTYAERTLQNHKRQLSPLGKRALMLYKDACAHFLEVVGRDAIDEDEEIAQAFRDQSIILIHEYEELITCTMSLQTTRSADAQMLQDEIPKLQRASFYAKCGEILVSVCRRLGNESEACKFASWKASGNGYWADVNCKLQDKKEKVAYALVLKGGSEGGSAIGKWPTHNHLAVLYSSRASNERNTRDDSALRKPRRITPYKPPPPD